MINYQSVYQLQHAHRLLDLLVRLQLVSPGEENATKRKLIMKQYAWGGIL